LLIEKRQKVFHVLCSYAVVFNDKVSKALQICRQWRHVVTCL